MKPLISTYVPQVHLLVAGQRSRFRVDSRRPHGFPCWFLTLTLKGRAVFDYPAGNFEVTPGDLTLIQPHTPLFYRDAPPDLHWSWLYVIFHPYPHWTNLLNWPQVAPGMMRLQSPANETGQRIHQTFRELLRHAEHPGEPAELLAMNALERLLLMLDPINSHRSAAPIDPRIDQVIRHIHTHLAEPLTVKALARLTHWSPSRLAHCFRESLGVAPMEYVDARRMEQARQLLSNSDLPIKAIGTTVGYPAPDHFSKRFRHLNGLSPQEFRSQPGAQIL